MLSKLNFNKKILFNFILIALGSEAIYFLYAIKNVLYNPYRDALVLTNGQLGFGLSLYGIVSTIAYIPCGWFMDRFSSRKMMAINLVLTGLTGFYLIAVPSYLSFLVICCIWGFTMEALYWSAVLKSVRCLAKDTSQGKAFGSLELARGTVNLLLNAGAVAIFAAFGEKLVGIKVALGISSVLIILFGILTWIFIPEEDYLHTNKASEKNKLALKGLIKCLKLPELWLIGLQGCGVYTIYIALTYFLPFLQDVYKVPVFWVAIFGMFTSNIVRMISAPVSGLLGDNLLKSATKIMRILFAFDIIFLGAVILMPKRPSFTIPAMILLILVTITVYMLRGVYYAPVGESGIPKEMSGSAMSVAIVLVQSPMFWAFAVFGNILDKYKPAQSYPKIFTIMLIFAFIGIIAGSALIALNKKKNKNVTADVS
jgi:MFS family permease